MFYNAVMAFFLCKVRQELPKGQQMCKLQTDDCFAFEQFREPNEDDNNINNNKERDFALLN